MWFDKCTCAECAYWNPSKREDGKGICEKPNVSGCDITSANKICCNGYIDIMNYKRSVTDIKNYWRIAKNHGYYLVTAMTSILNLPDYYLESFKYFKENILVLDEYQEFLNEYDNLGPYLAYKLINDKENYLFVVYLFDNYLVSFKKAIDNTQFDLAYDIYFELYGQVIDRYNLQKNPVKKKVD